ncbi:hypothetical protein [Streptomyces sp. x-80]|uniref:hypothetical protein n=1 Tax=Streptomyces sp. x-80 TaxID=2789282 RepID=UPI00397FE064
MAPFAEKFFTQTLALPYESTIVANTYYAAPERGSPLRLRINFHSGEYDGLRLNAIHLANGTTDTAVVSFADHEVFRARDVRLRRRPGPDGYGVFRDWPHDNEPPWKEGDFTPLRRAIERYAQVWFPTAGASVPASTRVSAPTQAPLPPRASRGRGTAARGGR